ncbi:hypothetical protein BKA69DRAFT_442162 [Paraphysoderma sedebokerense]|nr:hypothetical protein BKA69DRAFT_442162 [Paraphysoderma sedebokerense]
MKDKFSPEKEGLITAIPPPRYMLGEDAGISSKKKSWMDKLGLLIVVPLFAVLAVLAFRTTHVSVDIFIPFGRNSHSRHTFGPGQCSGHGVQIQKSCICDLGFSGSDCSQKVPYDIPAQPNSPSAEKSVALFLREFGNSSPDAESNVNVAKTLMKSGFKVTVVTVGTQEVQSIEGISVAKVESENIDYGSSATVSNSMAVYEYLQNNFYDVVYFDASTGYGYYTLLAQKQGLRCYSSKFIVGVNSFSDSLMEQINSGLDEPVTDVELLKQDFMRQKSIELADSVVFTGESLVRELDDPSKIVQKSRILNPISNNSVKPVRSSQIPKELVYVGDFNIASGLVLFCDALDNLHSIVSTSDIVVTFYGKSSSVGSIASDEYIKKRVAAWTKFKVNVNDKKADMKETVEYFTNSAVARLAVIPSSVTPNAVMTQELVLAGVQFVAARTPENEGLMTKESVEKVLFEIEDSYELSLRLLQALKLGGAYATSTVKDSGADWSKLFSKAADSEVTCQGEQTDKPFVSIVLRRI